MPQYINVEYLMKNHRMGKQRAYGILHLLNAEKVDGKLCVPQRVWCEYLDSLMQSLGYLGGVPLIDWLNPEKSPRMFRL